jgi:hypothetical protein
MRRFAAGPLHGVGLAIYFFLLPYVVVTRWNLSAHEANVSLIRCLLVVLSLYWLTFLLQLVENIVRLRRGHSLKHDGGAWLAGLVVMLLPFLLPSHAGATAAGSPTAISTPFVAPPAKSWWFIDDHRSSTNSPMTSRHSGPPLPATGVGAMPLALMAKKRRDELRQHQFALDESQVDDTVALLRASNPALVAALHRLIGDLDDGVVVVNDDPTDADESPQSGALVVCVLDTTNEGTLISFARAGGCLAVPAHWAAEDITNAAVALHDGGRLVFAHDEAALLRALAIRSLSSTLVLYLGRGDELDEELRACTVTLTTFEPGAPADHEPLLWGPRHTSATLATDTADLRVEVLRSDPRVVGLVEPFTATLRRRCVEMATYLALHRHEPVTGDRLRTRVLSNGDFDASSRTLANTASAVRRSLGADATGPRLHAVGPAGLYVTHALTSDLEIFHALVARARQLSTNDAAPLVREALSLVQGEPLASALRGFEWFLAEGHAARLARDGEWAALVLHHDALARGDVELAYWALEKGRLIDPYSDALVAALARVPRLRQFGGDGAGVAQHEAVGPGAGVARGRPFDGLRHQIA